MIDKISLIITPRTIRNNENTHPNSDFQYYENNDINSKELVSNEEKRSTRKILATKATPNC